MRINQHYHGDKLRLKPGDTIPKEYEDYFKKKFPNWILADDEEIIEPESEGGEKTEGGIQPLSTEKKGASFTKKKPKGHFTRGRGRK